MFNYAFAQSSGTTIMVASFIPLIYFFDLLFFTIRPQQKTKDIKNY